MATTMQRATQLSDLAAYIHCPNWGFSSMSAMCHVICYPHGVPTMQSRDMTPCGVYNVDVFQVEAKPSGKLAGKTFTIPLEAQEEWQAVKSGRSPSPNKDTSDKKKKKHKKHKKQRKHKSRGKDKSKDSRGAEGLPGGHDEDGESSDDDTPDGRPDSSNLTRQLEHGASVDQVLRQNGSANSGHGNVAMEPDDSTRGFRSVHASKVSKVDVEKTMTTAPNSGIVHASSQPDTVTGATGTGQTVKKSRALFGMAMGAVLRPGTLPGVKPKKR